MWMFWGKYFDSCRCGEFFLSNIWTKKLGGNISRCDEKGFRWGPYFSSCGSVFGFKKQHWATVSSPLWSRIVNSTRTNFSPHWKKCSFSCRSVFGLKQHWPLESIGTGFLLLWFCFCLKATLENVVPVGVFFGREAALDKVWNWEDLRLSGREVCRMKKNGRTAGKNIWEFRTTDIKVRRFGHMRVCVSEGVSVWRWENRQMGRGQNFILKENERERPRGRIESVFSRIHIERWLSAKKFYI